MVNIGTTSNEEVMKEFQKYFSEKFYKNHFPHNLTLSKTPSYGKNIFSYYSNVLVPLALAYQHLVNEILKSNDKKV